MVCGQSYKIYWEDIAMIELILLGEENEASSSNHFNSPNFWNNSKFFKVFKDGRGIGLYKFQWDRKSDAKLKLLKYFSKLTFNLLLLNVSSFFVIMKNKYHYDPGDDDGR